MPSMPFSLCSVTVMPVRDIVGDQRRDADAEVDVIAVLQLLRGPRRHLVAVPAFDDGGHQAVSLSRVVMNSIFLS